MSKKFTKQSKLTQTRAEELTVLSRSIIEMYDMELYVGAVCIGDHGMAKIIDIFNKKCKVYDNKVDKRVLKIVTHIKYYTSYNSFYSDKTEEENIKIREKEAMYDNVQDEWWDKDIEVSTVGEFVRRYTGVLNKTYPDLVEEVHKGILQEEVKEEVRLSSSTEVGFRIGKEEAFNIKLDIIRKINDVEVRKTILEHIAEAKVQELRSMMEVFNKQLKRVKRAIHTIELYLGVKEDIIQIQEGKKADVNVSINIRQQILFMDEEVGAIGKQEINYSNIEEFDKWVTTKENYKKIIPEEKGIVCLMIKRYSPKRADVDMFIQAREQELNSQTYLLIRNGENLYRIFTSIVVYPRLFPLQNEMQDLVKRMEESRWGSGKDQIEDDIFVYRRNIIILQGLIERTEIFLPLPFINLNLLNPESYGDSVVFIRDDEVALPDTRLSYHEWKKLVNKDIKRGSRVFISQTSRHRDHYHSPRDYVGRFLLYNLHESNTPPFPESGIYTVEQVSTTGTRTLRDKKGELIPNSPGYRLRGEEYYKQEKVITGTYLVIKYNPEDEINYRGWEYDPHTRQKKVSFVIKPEDFFVFNYDQVDLESVEFYINSRVNRKDYVSMLPILYGIRDMRLKELEWERHFVNFTVREIRKVLNIDSDKFNIDIELVIWDCIEWWKRKVIWKRPINKDDSKALRMIKGKVKKLLKDKLN